MKKIFPNLIITLCLLFSMATNAQTINYFTKTIATPNNGDDVGVSIATDNNCFVYVASASTGIGSGYDYLTTKYDMNGDTIWQRSFNGSANSNDYPVMVKTDNSGNVFVIGKSIGIGTAYDYCTIKYNSSGVFQWEKRFNNTNTGGNGDDIPIGLIIDGTGTNIYVGGQSLNFASSSSLNDYVIIKYDASNGNTVWTNPASYNFFDDDVLATSMAMTTNRIIITGYDPNPFQTTSERTAEFDLNGVLITSSGSTSNTNDLSIDGSNNIYCFGLYSGAVGSFKVEKYLGTLFNQGWFSLNVVTPLPYDVNNILNPAKIIATSNAIYGVANVGYYNFSIENDVFAFKINPTTGDTIWTRRIQNLGDDGVSSMALDANENIYYTGYVSSGTQKNIIINKLDASNGSTMTGFPIIYNGTSNLDDQGNAILVSSVGYFATGYSNNLVSQKDIVTLKNVYFLANADAGSDQTICSGESIQIGTSSTVGYTYSWNPTTNLTSSTISNPIANPTTNATFIVTATAGCTTDMDTMSLIVNPTPPIPTLTISGLNLTSSSTSNNQWYLNGSPISGATSQTHTMTQFGIYYVKVTNIFGCSSSSLDKNHFSTGITDATNYSNIKVYPNPVEDILNIELIDFQNASIKLFDLFGNIITTKIINSKKTQIPTCNFANGFYNLEIMNDGKKFNSKIIIQ
jgi:Secretion system C-terminal sorting domain